MKWGLNHEQRLWMKELEEKKRNSWGPYFFFIPRKLLDGRVAWLETGERKMGKKRKYDGYGGIRLIDRWYYRASGCSMETPCHREEKK